MTLEIKGITLEQILMLEQAIHHHPNGFGEAEVQVMSFLSELRDRVEVQIEDAVINNRCLCCHSTRTLDNEFRDVCPICGTVWLG